MDKLEVKLSPVDESQYYHAVYPKFQICGHHTVSGPGVAGDISWWNKFKDHVCTPYIVDREGVIHKCFDDSYWAYALGLKTSLLNQAGSEKGKTEIEKGIIHIELDSWGGLVKRGGFYYNGYGKKFTGEVVDYGNDYRGFRYFEKYTDKQIAAYGRLLCYLSTKYGIPIGYSTDLFQLSHKALRGERGLFSHSSYRPDKSDMHPQPELIEMLIKLND
jgi:hypothetical protein